MPATTVTLPEQIGRYRITGVIGRGGMGTVFRGHDDALARDVAVKVIHDRFSSTANVIRRFGAEARSVARLSSPHIVHVHEFDPLADPPFLAMELVQGPSLQRLIRDRGRASFSTVVECARQVLAGLAAAHAAGVIHRDIKPANVLRGADGVYKLTDFGLARSLEREQSLTASGSMLGTLHYMAPEVAAGEEATAASDLYSLGATLYEMLVGTPPFPADSPLRLLRRIATERPLPVRSHRDDIPPQLEAWLDRLLARDPADRFASAAAALDALRGVEIFPGPGDDFSGLAGEIAGPEGETAAAPAADPPAPIPRDQVDSIIRSAMRLEAQGRSLLGDDTLLEIARELNVDSIFVRRALDTYRAATAPPEPEPPLLHGASAVATANAALLDQATRLACADAIDRLWLAGVVGMGPSIPILQFPICGLISVEMGRRACLGALSACNRRFAKAADLSGPLIGVWLCCFAIYVVELFMWPWFPVSGLLGLVVSGMVLRVYWHELSGAAELLEQCGQWVVAQRIRTTRNRCLVVTAVLLIVAIVIGARVGMPSRGPSGNDPFQILLRETLGGLIMLPVTWLLGWLFTLRPLALASRTLRGAGHAAPSPWQGAS
ncbi:MAG: serine/threonine-protein kinase [Planctomycetia bacterium]